MESRPGLRRKARWWPWLVGIIVLLFMAWVVHKVLDKPQEYEDPSTITAPDSATPGPAVVPAPADL